MKAIAAKPRFDQARIESANSVLALFAEDSRIVIKGNCLAVAFRDKVLRWQCRPRQDFYPVWSEKWAHGGTATTALSQLIRWIQGKPVLPLGSWWYWSSVGLGRPNEKRMVNLLALAGYPGATPCVLCGLELEHAGDWWNLDGVSGPCCGWTKGCRQKRSAD